jgi:septal ring factor EnvC (AmiA/AmiB activator)
MAGIDPWVTLFGVFSTGGGLKLAFDAWKSWKNTSPREFRTADASIATVSRARDQLEDDNTRIRAERDEDRIRFAAERAEWASERLALRADIARLETQIRMEREQAAARYDSLLEHVHSLQRRTQGGDA